MIFEKVTSDFHNIICCEQNITLGINQVPDDILSFRKNYSSGEFQSAPTGQVESMDKEKFFCKEKSFADKMPAEKTASQIKVSTDSKKIW